MAKSQVERRADLEAAVQHYRRRPKAMMTMDEMAALYGLTKPAFHNIHDTMPGFPDVCERKGNTFFYPAGKAAVAMLAYVTRKEKAKVDHARKFQSLVRPVAPREDGPEPLTAAEQLKAFELRERLTNEEIASGALHRADHCAAVSDRVFSLISRTFGSKVSDSLDPNGVWPAEVRTAIDKAGEDLVLQCFTEMKHMLTAGVTGAATADADKRDPGPPPARSPRRGAGKGRKVRQG